MATRLVVAGWTKTDGFHGPTWRPDVDLSDAAGWGAVDLSDDPDAHESCLVAVTYNAAAPPAVALSKGGEVIDLGVVDGDRRQLSEADTTKVAQRLDVTADRRQMTPGELAAAKLGQDRIVAAGIVLHDATSTVKG